MADAEEIAVGGEKVGDDLDMQMGGPAAIFRPVSQMGDDLACGDLSCRVEGGKGGCEVAVKGEEAGAVQIMFEDEGVTVIQRVCIVGKAVDPARQRGVDGGSGRGEDVDAEMDGPSFGGGGIGELRRGVDRAVFPVEAKAVAQTCGLMRGEPWVEGRVGKSGHVGMRAGGGKGHGGTCGGIGPEEGVKGGGGQCGADVGGMWDRAAGGPFPCDGGKEACIDGGEARRGGRIAGGDEVWDRRGDAEAGGGRAQGCVEIGLTCEGACDGGEGCIGREGGKGHAVLRVCRASEALCARRCNGGGLSCAGLRVDGGRVRERALCIGRFGRVRRGHEAGGAQGLGGAWLGRLALDAAGVVQLVVWARSAGVFGGDRVRELGRELGRDFGRELGGCGAALRAVAAGFLLVGCVAEGAGLRSVPLLDGALIAAAPPGYCLAPGAGRRSGDSAVVLMGRCSATSMAAPAVLTLSVGPTGSAGAMGTGGAELAAYFTSADGRAALSRRGRAGDVAVLEAVGAGEAFLLHVRDRAVGDYWRAVTGVRGRLVTVTAAGPDGQALDEGKGRSLVEAAVASLRRANPG